MKKNLKITAVFISCLLFLTVPLRAAAPDGIPEDAGVVTAQEEEISEDSVYEGEIREDAAEPEESTQTEGSDDLAKGADPDEEGKDESVLPDQEVENAVQEPAPAEDMPGGGQEAAGQEQEEAGEDPSAEPETYGVCGEEIFWEYSEGILSITGRGEMYDYSYAEEAVPGWSVFSDLVEEIHIGEGVTLLDLDAFTGFTALKVISFNGSADAWASVMLSGEEEAFEENIFNSTEIHFAEQEETAGETVETEDGIEDEIEGPDQDPEVGQSEENEAQDPAEGQPEGDEAQDPADVQPEEGEEQEPAFEQHEDTENQDPAEENSEEPADGEQPAEEAPAEEAGIAGTEEQAATDAEDQEDPEEAIADGKSEEPAAEEKKEEPSVEEKKEEPAAEEPVVADGEQPSSGAKETVPDVLLEQGDEETAADDAAGASQGTPLAITSQPEDAEAPVGQTVSFHVGANRTDASYQWQFSTNGTTWKICTSAGSNTDTFSFLMKDTLNGRMYRCAVTAGGTTLISDAAAVSLKQEQQAGTLSITAQPEDAEASAGQTVSFHVGANRTDASYQWQFSTNGTTWKICTSAGSNTDTFSFLMKDTLDGRKYRCAVTADGTTIISGEATVRLPQQQGDLTITQQPQDVEAAAGETVSLHVGANMADAPFQWQFSTNGTTWKACTSAGSNTDTFSFLMKETLDGRKYRCAVTGGGKTIISEEATVRLPQQGGLSITQQPQDVEAAAGQTVSLHVGANMTDASYQWQFSTNGTTWKACTSAGSNTDTFSFLMKETLDGRKYRCAVTGGGKTLTSAVATVSLSQQEPLALTVQPEDTEAQAGEPVSLHVAANLTGVTYQWQFSTNGTTWKNCTSAGCNTDTFSFLMKETLDGRKYRCAVTGGGMTLISDTITVTLASSQIIIEDVIYEMVDGKMTVTGHRGTRTSYTVQETVKGTTVTVIGEKAFENNTLIQEIHLPDTIQVIRKRAFAGCTNLANMD